MVDYHILLKNLEYYDVRGISNKQFAFCLVKRNQFALLSGYNSNLPDVK